MAILNKTDPSTGSPVSRELSNFKKQLEHRRLQINKEIGNYPAPIPACDAQFNYLLEKRSRISAVLKLIDALLTKSESGLIDLKTVDELGKMSNRIDKGLADTLKKAISQSER